MVQFGGRAEGEFVPFLLPEAADGDDNPDGDNTTVRRLSSLVGAWIILHGADRRIEAPDVFLSYPHSISSSD